MRRRQIRTHIDKPWEYSFLDEQVTLKKKRWTELLSRSQYLDIDTAKSKSQRGCAGPVSDRTFSSKGNRS